jgi:hypothetical protein
VGDVLIGMLPLMVAAALVPAPLIIVLTLLRGPSGLAAGAAFLVGMTLVRVAQGALFGFVLVDAMGAEGRAEPRPVVATLLLILGLLLWITAVKTLLKEEDPDAPPPRWLERLRTASPLAAFAIGAGFIAIAAKQWVFTLGALGVVAEASLNRTEATIAYLLFVLGAVSLVLLPVLFTAVAREAAAAVLERIGTWMERNNRGIKIVVSVVFGTYFLWKGLSGLLG